MKTLYLSDLDGTLLRSDERASDFSVRTINGLIKEGMVFSYATARSLHSASPVTKGLKLENPVILHNGVFIIDPKSGERILSNHFSGDEVKTASAFLNEQGIYPLVYSFMDGKERVSWLTGQERGGIKNYLYDRKGDSRLREAENTEDLYRGDVYYFTCIGEYEELLPVYNYFKKIPSFNTVFQREIYYPEYWCEFMPKTATKANAALRLKEILECDRIVCFGDGLNDISMFEVSDECYAVANAASALKEKATGIIGSNEDDSVAKWLKQNWASALSLPS